MLTKQQKIEKVEEGKKLLDKSRSLIFIDFGGKSVVELEKLRRNLGELGAKVKVIKKRLLKIALRDKKIDFDPEQFESQLGTVFAPKEIFEVAGSAYKSGIKVVGGYDLEAKSFFDAEKMKFIGQLPPREVLLGQLVSMLAAPIRMFLHALNEKGRKE